MVAVLLGLGASIAFGIGDFLGGLTAKTRPLILILLVSQLTGAVIAFALAPIFESAPPAVDDLAPAAAAGVTYACGSGALFHALAIGRMGVIAPLSASSALIPVGLGVWMGDPLAWIQGIGVAFCLLGITLMVSESESDDSPAGRHQGRSLAFGFLAAGLLGSTTVLLDQAVSGGPLWAVFVARLAAAAVVGSYLLALGRRRPSLRRFSPAMVGVGLADSAAQISLAVALTRGDLGVTAVLATLYPAVTVLLARWTLRERLQWRQGVGAFMSVLGVVALSVP